MGHPFAFPEVSRLHLLVTSPHGQDPFLIVIVVDAGEVNHFASILCRLSSFELAVNVCVLRRYDGPWGECCRLVKKVLERIRWFLIRGRGLRTFGSQGVAYRRNSVVCVTKIESMTICSVGLCVTYTRTICLGIFRDTLKKLETTTMKSFYGLISCKALVIPRRWLTEIACFGSM